MTAGELLRDTRLRHGLSQAQLARRAGTSQAAISRIERGLVSPSVDTLATLLDRLGEELVLEARENDWGHDRTLIRSNLARSPLQRIENVASAARGLAALRGLARRA